jgi:hypothetical protein
MDTTDYANATEIALANAAQVVGMDAAEFRWWFAQLNGRLRFLEREGWPEQFQAARARHTETRAHNALLAVLQHGPVVFGRMSDEERLACVSDETVRRFALEVDGTRDALIVGKTGIGKSAAAVHVLARVVRAAYEAAISDAIAKREALDNPLRIDFGVAWVRALELYVPSNQWGMAPAFVERLEALATVRLLVVDDLGYETCRDAVSHLLHTRYDNQLTTIITSGLTYSDLAARYGGALVRRMVGRGVLVDAFGSPLRALRGGAS